MTSNKIKKLVVSFFSNMNLFNQHKTEKEVREGLNFVPIEEIFKFLGVRWSLAENGYICFGKLFGGLIIQWGKSVETARDKYTYFPIAFTNKCYTMLGTINEFNNDGFWILPATKTRFQCGCQNDWDTGTNVSRINWMAIGI